ncbi:hypothetical protein H480_22677 [Amycolatopsis vancoresmycina DSM 44592]|uniref:Uncharacterized protein n=1 Tax=Amycolatopsis vancoresmycina DSM 44592 TaxID=1292037 RepID=R1G3Z2_9PSEU|nr:hypothetical protein H480_22677 [Amycolatopsis vancoresmycina DSM 44592]
MPASSGPGQPVLALLDKAVGVQAPLVRKNIARARQRNPEATPAEVVRTLERMFVSALAGTGAAVGATAAAPAVGGHRRRGRGDGGGACCRYRGRAGAVGGRGFFLA